MIVIRIVWGLLLLASLCLMLLYWRTQKPLYLHACKLLFKLTIGMTLIVFVLFFISRFIRF